MKAGAYGRNSKPPKGWRPSFPGEEPPGSWTIQIAKCRDFARAMGDDIVLEEHDVVTGADPNRPAWARVTAAVRGHRIQRVYVSKLDRVMRGARHFLEIAEEFEKHGAELVFVDQPGATVRKGDPGSKAFRGMLAVWAEFELDMIRERSAAVMEYREDGRLYGPRSARPAGRPVEFGPEHKFRTRRDGSREHVVSRCGVCRAAAAGSVGEQGGESSGGSGLENGGVGEPVGFPTVLGGHDRMKRDAGTMPDEMHVDGQGVSRRGEEVVPSGGDSANGQ